MNLFYQPRLSEGYLYLDEDESQHAIKVLRHEPGDEIPVTDGKGNFYLCQIESIAKKSCSLKIIRSKSKPKQNHHIHIALAPTKSTDRMEWFVEKSVEIGIQEITFIATQRSERTRVNIDRMHKTAIAALKQSGQLWKPLINDLTEFKSILNFKGTQKFIAHVDDQNISPLLSKSVVPNSDYLVLIGPEGDFTNQEITMASHAGFKSISLGNNTLRTETAALFSCAILNLANQA